MDEKAHEVTNILQEWRGGDSSAAERLFPLVYDELKRQARQFLHRERVEHTLQPTALVHEAYLRMVDRSAFALENRNHFFGVAARVMRQVLVDHARSHNAEKRGGAAQRLSLDDLGEMNFSAAESASDILALNEALEKLAAVDRRKCAVVDMRFFGGMNETEIAAVLNVTEKTVGRDWHFAKLWLFRELSQPEQPAV